LPCKGPDNAGESFTALPYRRAAVDQLIDIVIIESKPIFRFAVAVCFAVWLLAVDGDDIINQVVDVCQFNAITQLVTVLMADNAPAKRCPSRADE
jgi:hypothetical protein